MEEKDRAKISRENGKKGGRPPKPLNCTCGAAEGEKHKTSCRAYVTAWRREKKNPVSYQVPISNVHNAD